ncbi:MAG: hypothetical protein M3Q65_14445 [Chloroflexota bacterium]|nr:hypothetical protein [Chloroflexota bacterium]
MSFFFVVGVFHIIGGAVVLTISAGQAVTLVRPPQSAPPRRLFRLPWECEPLPARRKRRKQTLYVAGMFIFGLTGFLRGWVEVSALQHTFLHALAVLLMFFSAIVLLAADLLPSGTR